MEAENNQTKSYLTFRLAEEIFAASVDYVSEILELSKITKVPRSPQFMRGVINLRGSVLPVIDTRLKFGLEAKEDTVNTCIMVLQVEVDGQGIMIGALVDAVQEVLEIEPGSIQQPPSIGSRYRTEFLTGMVKTNEQFIMLLNIDKVFNSEEISLLEEVQNESITS